MMPSTSAASRRELIRIIHHTESRLRILIDMLGNQPAFIIYRLTRLADRLARVLAREASSSAGDD